MDREAYFRRTMHTPDDPERAEWRAALREISRALIPLHRALIDAARDDYAFGYAPVEGPSHLLRLLNDDPFFAWLKPMTTLIVDIDEMARADFDRDAVGAIAARLDRLFGADVDSAFAERYVPILQRDVDVAVGHAAVRQALGRLRRK
ncbi:MAG TPA: hypothetical protein VJ276_20430 [Thermoanaerobaculia bacterium]|nr:hypothetical protein [Thermoanaerobaculia bacterium]